jgi:hypothetical protein
LGTLLTFEVSSKFPVSMDYGSLNYTPVLKFSTRRQARLHHSL